MATLFEAVVDRVATVLALAAARELEADALTQHGERTAGLMRLADGYQAEGFTELATDLRRRACRSEETPSVDVATVSPSLNGSAATHALPAASEPTSASPKKKTK